MPFIKIDNRELDIRKGETIFEAARRAGIEIPFYCYHPGLKIVASCRMCLVDMVGAPKPVPACSTTVAEMPPGKKLEDKYDAIILTENERVITARASVLEFLLLNHPIDCPICDKAGECKLQDYSYEHGYDTSRFIEPKRVPQKKDLGPTIYLYTSRCIMCSRCVRFTEEISGTEELKVIHRGNRAEIGTFPGRPLDNKMMGNVVDLCPVGCLIDKHEKFEGRVWNYVQTNSICPGCSKGCNTVLDTMKHQKLNLEELVDQVYRIRPRENMGVNQWWICDDGRYYLETLKGKARVLVPRVRQNGALVETSWEDAVKRSVEAIKGAAGYMVFAGSPYFSNEENHALAKLARALQAAIELCAPVQGYTQTFKTEMNKYPFTIEAEKAPNFRGAKDVLGLTSADADKKLNDPSTKTAVVFGSPSVTVTRKPGTLIVIGTHEDALSGQADVVLPAAMFTETNGTFTNKDGHVQRFNKAIQPAGEARAAWQIVLELAAALGHAWYYESVGDLAREMMEQVPAFRSASLASLYPQFEYVDEQIAL